jgi:hypothetical protein
MAARQLGGAERQNQISAQNMAAAISGGEIKMAAARINGSIKRGVAMTRSSA